MPSDPTPPITPEELQEMKRRCDEALHVTLSRMVIAVGPRHEEFVGMSREGEVSVHRAMQDLPRLIAEIERLQSLLSNQRH